MLGNDDYLLRLMRDGASQTAIEDYVALTVDQTRSLGLKCINPGGCEGFKENNARLRARRCGALLCVTSRQIFQTLQRATQKLGIHHPLHLHMNNLGIAGNIDTALATIDAAQGLPLHLAHVQFYAYGKEGKNGFSSAAAAFAEKINANKNVTVDIGAVMFSQTVTISSDVLKQFQQPVRRHAEEGRDPRRRRQWRRRRALCLQGLELLQRRAMDRRPRTVSCL